MDAYTIKTDVFEGPFDLLFHLIEKNKVDIYDIPVSLITDQYLEYIAAMRELDLDVASEFLVMASTLLHIKSRLLLPPPARADGEEEIVDPRDELVVNMIEYKKYKEFTAALREQSVYWDGACFRDETLPADAKMLQYAGGAWRQTLFDADRDRLMRVYRKLLDDNRRKYEDVGAKVDKIIERERVPLELKIREILKFLASTPRFVFQKLFDPAKTSRRNIVTAFIAILELSRQNRLRLTQDKPFDGLLVSRGDDSGGRAEADIKTDTDDDDREAWNDREARDGGEAWAGAKAAGVQVGDGA